MKKIKVGFLPLYIKLYDDANGVGYRAPMEKYMHMAINMLEAQGIDVVLSDVCRIKPEFDAAAAMFNEAEVDAVITMHLAYSPSLEGSGKLDNTDTFAVIGATIADNFGVEMPEGTIGTSLLSYIK